MLRASANYPGAITALMESALRGVIDPMLYVSPSFGGRERRTRGADKSIAPTTSQASRFGVLLVRGRWLLLRLEDVSLMFHFVGCLFCCWEEGWVSADVLCPSLPPTTEPFLVTQGTLLDQILSLVGSLFVGAGEKLGLVACSPSLPDNRELLIAHDKQSSLSSAFEQKLTEDT
jgi:hypothetical protein